MTLIKSKINPLAWLKSVTYISVVGVIILLPKSASAFHLSLFTDTTETRGLFGLGTPIFLEFQSAQYVITETYWEGVINITEDRQYFNNDDLIFPWESSNDVLTINGFLQHISIPSHPEDEPTGRQFSFNLVVDPDNTLNTDDPADDYLVYQMNNTYAHSEHSDSFRAWIGSTTGDYGRITSWSFALEGNHRSEPVPEPTTIFGSAIGLCLGGWLKRKKSSLPNKTRLQS
jgi:hypothetical protein